MVMDYGATRGCNARQMKGILTKLQHCVSEQHFCGPCFPAQTREECRVIEKIAKRQVVLTSSMRAKAATKAI